MRAERSDPLEVLAVRGPEAARVLSVSQSTLDRLRRAGKLPSLKVNGTRLFPLEGLRAFIAQSASTEGGEP